MKDVEMVVWYIFFSFFVRFRRLVKVGKVELESFLFFGDSFEYSDGGFDDFWFNIVGGDGSDIVDLFGFGGRSIVIVVRGNLNRWYCYRYVDLLMG